MIFIIKIAVVCLRVIYIPFKLLLKPKNKITMLSRQYNKPPLSYTLTKEAVNKIDSDIEVIILAKKVEGNLLKKIEYCFHVIQQMYHIATSKIVIVDGFCIPVSVLHHKKNQTIIQMWHALNVIKKFGYLALDKPAGVNSKLAKVMCMHQNYTHILAGSQKTGEIYQKSFNSTGEIVILGLPYLDYIQNPNKNKIEEIYNKYPKLKDKTNILYAPTFRKHHNVNLEWITDYIDLEKYNVIVKLHPVDKQGFDEKVDSRIICDDSFMSFEWLWICDHVITDYSGISVESAILNKRLYFYLYDKERYENETGLNVDLYEEPIRKYVSESAKDLALLLEEEYDYSLLEEYKKKYVEFDLNDCSGQFAHWLLNKLNEDERI